MKMQGKAVPKRSRYDFIQTNGQRVYAPSFVKQNPPPQRGSEVFIGNLPKNMNEDELLQLFESVGPLYQFRLMMDFKYKNRGFAFATYFNPEDADLAVQTLAGYEIRRGTHIGVFKSVDNRRLFIGNLPLHVTKQELFELLEDLVDGVVDVIMYSDHTCSFLNRGFAFAEFENHRLAAKARKQFAPANLSAWGQALFVDWADPIPEVDPRIMAEVCNLYLKNLPIEYTSQELHTVLCNIVGSQIIKRVHKINNYAFAHFVNRRAAEFAINRLRGLKLKDSLGFLRTVQFEWARPRCFSKQFRLSSPQHFCRSVPPDMRRMILEKTGKQPASVYGGTSSGGFDSNRS